MFSQYSWWDFIKFVLVLAVPYYAFVLWKYYREDIREWISNRGQPQPVSTMPEGGEEEEPSSSIFSVTDYSKTDVSVSKAPAATPKPAEWLPAPSTGNKFSVVPLQETVLEEPEVEELDESEEIELQGPALDAEPTAVFGLPVVLVSDNAGEESVDVLQQAATRLSTDEQGKLSPKDTEDKPAVRIAEIINQQANPLDTFAFNR